jgi:hypothetical protein
MATLTKPPAPQDCWTWTAELDGDADRCRYGLHRDGLLLVSGSIEALDGSHRAELHDQRLGETPHDLAELHGAWQWTLAECRELMLALDAQIDWQPWPDARGGVGWARRRRPAYLLLLFFRRL